MLKNTDTTNQVQGFLNVIENINPEQEERKLKEAARKVAIDKAIIDAKQWPKSKEELKLELQSEREIDYTRLRDLLAAEQWLQANLETEAIMLKVVRREQKGSLRVEDIEKFPSVDLRTIDRLWVKHSKGRFGFSVQKRIWEAVGGTKNPDYETYKRFGQRIGWYVESWPTRGVLDLCFTINSPEGHLPYVADVYVSGVDCWQYSERDARRTSGTAILLRQDL